jgi:site-specific DNA recombinase
VEFIDASFGQRLFGKQFISFNLKIVGRLPITAIRHPIDGIEGTRHPPMCHQHHMSWTASGHVFYYRCAGRYNTGICDAPGISETKIEKALFNSLEMIIEEIPEPPEPTDNDPKKEMERIEKEIEQIKKRRKKWQEAFAADVITLDELRERTKEDGEREKQLKEELLMISQRLPVAHISKEEFQQAIKDISKVWEHATRGERKELLHSIFKRIVVNKEGSGNNSKAIITDYELS